MKIDEKIWWLRRVWHSVLNPVLTVCIDFYLLTLLDRTLHRSSITIGGLLRFVLSQNRGLWLDENNLYPNQIKIWYINNTFQDYLLDFIWLYPSARRLILDTPLPNSVPIPVLFMCAIPGLVHKTWKFGIFTPLIFFLFCNDNQLERMSEWQTNFFLISTRSLSTTHCDICLLVILHCLG